MDIRMWSSRPTGLVQFLLRLPFLTYLVWPSCDATSSSKHPGKLHDYNDTFKVLLAVRIGRIFGRACGNPSLYVERLKEMLDLTRQPRVRRCLRMLYWTKVQATKRLRCKIMLKILQQWHYCNWIAFILQGGWCSKLCVTCCCCCCCCCCWCYWCCCWCCWFRESELFSHVFYFILLNRFVFRRFDLLIQKKYFNFLTVSSWTCLEFCWLSFRELCWVASYVQNLPAGVFICNGSSSAVEDLSQSVMRLVW